MYKTSEIIIYETVRDKLHNNVPTANKYVH